MKISTKIKKRLRNALFQDKILFDGAIRLEIFKGCTNGEERFSFYLFDFNIASNVILLFGISLWFIGFNIYYEFSDECWE